MSDRDDRSTLEALIADYEDGLITNGEFLEGCEEYDRNVDRAALARMEALKESHLDNLR